MKDQIKKWYKKHEEDIKDTALIGGCALGVVSISFFYGFVLGHSRVDVEGLWSGHDDDGNDGFRVALTNKRQAYFFPPAEAAA